MTTQNPTPVPNPPPTSQPGTGNSSGGGSDYDDAHTSGGRHGNQK